MISDQYTSKDNYIDQIQDSKDIEEPLEQVKPVKDYFNLNKSQYVLFVEKCFELDRNSSNDFMLNKSENILLDNYMGSEKLLLNNYLKNLNKRYKLDACLHYLRCHIEDLIEELSNAYKRKKRRIKAEETKNLVKKPTLRLIPDKLKVERTLQIYIGPKDQSYIIDVSDDKYITVSKIPTTKYIILEEKPYLDVDKSNENYLSIPGVPILNKFTSSDYNNDLLKFSWVVNNYVDCESTYFSNIINPLISNVIKYCNIKNQYYIKDNDIWKPEDVTNIYLKISNTVSIKILEINQKIKGIHFINQDFKKICKEYIKKLEKVKNIANTEKYCKKYLQRNKIYFTEEKALEQKNDLQYKKYLDINRNIFNSIKCSEKNSEHTIYSKNNNTINVSNFDTSLDLYKNFIRNYVVITKNPEDHISRKKCLDKFFDLYYPMEKNNHSLILKYRKNIKNLLLKYTNLEQEHRDNYWGCLLRDVNN